jgi:hypothetical protein
MGQGGWPWGLVDMLRPLQVLLEHARIPIAVMTVSVNVCGNAVDEKAQPQGPLLWLST